MKKYVFKKKKFWVVIGVFGLMWVYSLFSYINFHDRNYVGPIVTLATGSLTVDDGKVGITQIYYNEKTPIYSRNGSKIELGTPVFVGITKSKDGNPLQAEFIRILDKERFPNQP